MVSLVSLASGFFSDLVSGLASDLVSAGLELVAGAFSAGVSAGALVGVVVG